MSVGLLQFYLVAGAVAALLLAAVLWLIRRWRQPAPLMLRCNPEGLWFPTDPEPGQVHTHHDGRAWRWDADILVWRQFDKGPALKGDRTCS